MTGSPAQVVEDGAAEAAATASSGEEDDSENRQAVGAPRYARAFASTIATAQNCPADEPLSYDTQEMEESLASMCLATEASPRQQAEMDKHCRNDIALVSGE